MAERKKNLPALPSDISKVETMDGIADDLLAEVGDRLLDSVTDWSTAPITADSHKYPLTSLAGRYGSRLYDKLHKLVDDSTTDGPAKGTQPVATDEKGNKTPPPKGSKSNRAIVDSYAGKHKRRR
jgi:hypothetical protein